MNKLEILQKAAPFNLLEPDQLAELAPKLEEVVFPRGTYIFRQGDSSLKKLFLLISGVVEIIVTNEKGADSVVGLRKPYDFFGETVLLTGKSYPASVRVVTDATCLTLSRDEFEQLFQKHPPFSGFFSQMLSDRLREMFREVVQEQSYDAYGMDSQPFRKRICDIMSTPVITCAATDTIDRVAELLTDHRISSLVVVDTGGKPVGLVTDSDLVSKVLTRKDCPNTRLTAAEVMSPNLVSLPPDAFFNQALLAMVKNKIKTLPIIDNGQLLGIVAVRDLVQSRSTGALTIVDGIENSTDIDQLVKASEQVDTVLKALIAEKASNQEINEVITEFYDRLTKKVIEISELEMLRESYGPPPAHYCWITMGSGGRQEQTMRTDQDNGIIYADVPIGKVKIAAAYFAALAGKIVEGLARCGFARCKGNVMATNPQWCKSVTQWEEMVSHWIHEPQPEMLLNFTIFLDFRPIHGDKSLAENLRRFVIKSIQGSPIILHFLAKDDLARKVPLGLFKQFITNKSKEHRNELNLKRDACVHMVDCIRLFAIREGIAETSTIGRLKELTEKGVFPRDDAEFWEAAYETLMNFRTRENLRKASLGLEPDNFINPYKLSKREQNVLREAFLAVSRLQSFTGSYFRVEGY